MANAMPLVREEPLQAVEMGAGRGAEPFDELRRAPDQVLHVRILGVEDAQRVGVQPALRIFVELRRASLEVGDQVRAVRAALFGIADRIDREARAVGDAKRAPQPRQHHDLLGVDVRTGEAQRLDVELVELPVAPLLRPLVAEHRAHGPHALRPLVGERMLDGGTNDSRRWLRDAASGSRR